MTSPIKSISAVIAGTIIVYFWGFLSWMVMDWHRPKAFSNPEGLSQVIGQIAPEHGIYALPAPSEDGEPPSQEAISKGPFIYAVVRPGARENYSLSTSIIGGAAISLMGSIALAAIMQMGAQAFIPRVLIGVFVGFLVAVNTALPALNWFEYPMSHTLAIFFDGLVPWSLAGLAMALILKPAKETES